jgi:uncharacterized protein (DUF488 family)
MRENEFREALDAVLADAEEATTAVMCSEALWWRCHRRLVADACTLVRRWPVLQLLHDRRLQPHAVTDGARLEGGEVVYDGGQLPLG